MSKIAGINLGGPGNSFQIYGSQLGGRDETVIINRASANPGRLEVDEITKQVNLFAKDIFEAIEALEVLQEMMKLEDDADSVIFDKGFIQEYSDKVKSLRDKFEGMLEIFHSK